ncbi:MAG: hypothetical protein M0000_08815 [Actinomycetota bacterium]|nr:hypothetical protein [Actinomycetota bacterium]
MSSSKRMLSSVAAAGFLVSGLVAYSGVAPAAAADEVLIANASLVSGTSSREAQAMSEDGRYLVMIGRSKADQGVYLVDHMKNTSKKIDASMDQNPAISPDGRYVAWSLYGSDRQVYLYDAKTGTTKLVSVDANGVKGSGLSDFPSVSQNGTYVVFQSTALLAGQYSSTGGTPTEIYAYDTKTGAVIPVSATVADGVATLGAGNSIYPSITPDGHYVVFASQATNLIPGATTSGQQVFVHDMQTGTNTVVSTDAAGALGDANSAVVGVPSISDDGRYVAFDSDATNLVAGDTNAQTDAFVKDTQTGTITRVSVNADGSQATAVPTDYTLTPPAGAAPQISGNGSFVAFQSFAPLTPDDVNGVMDVYSYDLVNNTVTRDSVANSSGTDATGTKVDGHTGATVDLINGQDPDITYDGRYVSFSSNGNLTGDRTVSTEEGTTGVSTESAIYVRTFGAPTVTSVTPNSAGRGRNAQSITVTGTNFSKPFAEGDLPVSLGDGTTVTSVTWISSTQLDLKVDVSAVTTTGTRDVSIMNPGSDTAAMAGAFNVTARGTGYRFAASDGGVFNFGTSPYMGSMGGTKLNQPVVGMANSNSGNGYWMVAKDGGVFTFGDASFFGSTGAMKLNQPIVGMAGTHDGQGYWLVASDGGVFSFGDATFFGSTGAMKLNQPIVGMAVTPSGNGYWLVAKDGGIFSFGDAAFYGSTGALKLNQPVVGMTVTPSGNGYWMVASDGGIFSFGDAGFYGSMGGTRLNAPVVGMASVPDANGYWLVARDGGVFSFGAATFLGSTGGMRLNQPIVAMAAD